MSLTKSFYFYENLFLTLFNFQAAAKTFDSLHNTVGSRALDDILPPMLKQLEMEHDDEVEIYLFDKLHWSKLSFKGLLWNIARYEAKYVNKNNVKYFHKL